MTFVQVQIAFTVVSDIPIRNTGGGRDYDLSLFSLQLIDSPSSSKRLVKEAVRKSKRQVQEGRTRPDPMIAVNVSKKNSKRRDREIEK